MERRRAAAALSSVALLALLLTLLLPKVQTTTPTVAPCDPAVVVSTWLTEKGFAENSFKISLTGFQTRKGSESQSAGSDAFASNPVLSLEQLNQLLSAKTGSAGKAAKIIKKRLDGRTVTPVAVMFLAPVNIEGNLGINGGNVVNLGTRKSAKHDVVWLFVDQANCQVIDNLVVRAGCGNPGGTVVPPVKPEKPKKPKVTPSASPSSSASPSPSETPTTPPPPPPPPPPICPPGQNVNPNGVCVNPKPGWPGAYTYPSGKPPAPQVTTPAETVPPPVQTQKPGGNGVVDSPTKPPGSETGVTAPGATPAPTTTPSAIPSNEGGSNNGNVAGF